MHQQLLGYKVQEKIHLGVRERKRSNITGLAQGCTYPGHQFAQATDFRTVAPNICGFLGMEHDSCHTSGDYNFKAPPTFFRTCAPLVYPYLETEDDSTTTTEFTSAAGF